MEYEDRPLQSRFESFRLNAEESCPSCGETVTVEDVYCPHCGEVLAQWEAQAAVGSAPTSPQTAVMLVLVGVALVLAAVGLGLYHLIAPLARHALG